MDANEGALVKLSDTTVNAATKIDGIISECLPISSGVAANFMQGLMIAKAVHELKQIMLNTAEIRSVVNSMANNRLGFLTDRTPAILHKNKMSGKGPVDPYRYEQLVNPIVEGLLKGYRISGNEINIISGEFYAAKSGNHRLIVEYPGISNFQYNNSPAEISGAGKTASVKCWSSWQLNGKEMSIGIDSGDELIIVVRVNYEMREDAIVGKAHSKLFKRVLERITGLVAPESTDVDAQVYDADFSVTDQTTAKKNTGESMVIDRSNPLPISRNPQADNRPPAGYDLAGNPIKPIKSKSAPQSREGIKQEFESIEREFGEGVVNDAINALGKVRILPDGAPANTSVVKMIAAKCSQIKKEKESF